MKKLTTNLKYFAIALMVLTLTFSYYLYSFIASEQYTNIIVLATAFGISVFAVGLYFGYNDKEVNTKIDLGFNYHLFTYIIVNGIGIIWLFSVLGFTNENIKMAASQLLFWGIGLFVHYLFSRRSIKGYDRDTIFK